MTSTDPFSDDYNKDVEDAPKNRRRLITFLIVAAVLAGLGYLVYQRLTLKPAAPMMPPPPQVSVLDIKTADMPLVYEYAGRTAGSREVEIRARVSGILIERTYVEGSPVKEGDVLFKIDPAPYQAALADAQARLTQAEQDWKRSDALFAAQAVSASARDQAQSNLSQYRAQVKTAQINLGYTTVRAPISGVTSEEGLSQGSLVTADTSLLTRISKLDPMYVNFAYPDSEALNQRSQIAGGGVSLPDNGMLMAEIHLADDTVYPVEGTINFTDSMIDPQTGTIRARAVLPNPDGKILPGQFVRVFVKGAMKKNAITIPDQAVMQGPQGAFVYTVTQDSKAAIRPVTLGLLNNKMRVIDQGLNAGDRIITDGMVKVRPDSPVTVADPNAAANPAAPADAAKQSGPKADAKTDAAPAAKPDAADPDTSAKDKK